MGSVTVSGRRGNMAGSSRHEPVVADPGAKGYRHGMSKSARTPLLLTALMALVAPLLATAGIASAQRPPNAVAPSVRLVSVVEGLNQPTDVTSRPGSDRLFITEKCGAIKLWDGTELTRVGSVRKRIRCSGETGLLSIAAHPDFKTNRRMFLYFTRKDTGDIQIAEVKVRKGKLVDGSFKSILRIRHRQASNHNGGDLVFGVKGALYISTGDGGGGGNQFGHSQEKTSLLGKVLRINVDRGSPYAIPRGNPFSAGEGRREIWAMGLRNPWRMSLDAEKGDLWIGDVGQDAQEEVDRVAGGKGRLRNFGWSRYEGDEVFDADAVLRGGRLIEPVTTYGRSDGFSVIGGGVYRGQESPGLSGFYVYGDLQGWVRGLNTADPSDTFQVDAPTDQGLFTISQAGDGELYAGYANGTLYRVVDAS
jgi:glucose/arabinose dehydrogenase